MGSAACAPAHSVLVFLKKSQHWGMQPHIALLCLLCWGIAVEAKGSMGLLQRSKRFSQFKTVCMGEVWNELKSSKVVSYTLTRDLTVFLFVQMLWISLHLLFWNGSIVEKRRTGLLGFDSDTDRRVDLAKIENFFMNPKTVSRNLMVCSGFFLLTASFWLIPSFLWKSSLASEREDDQDANPLDLDMVLNGYRRENFRSGVCTGDCWSRGSVQPGALSHLHPPDHCHQHPSVLSPTSFLVNGDPASKCSNMIIMFSKQ